MVLFVVKEQSVKASVQIEVIFVRPAGLIFIIDFSHPAISLQTDVLLSAHIIPMLLYIISTILLFFLTQFNKFFALFTNKILNIYIKPQN